MELRVGRPQKPFTVEVRRGRKAAAAPQQAVTPKPVKTKEPAAAAVAERQPVASPPPPPRRILDAIEPDPAPAEAHVEVVEALDKPRRGRPPKAETAVATRKPGRPRREQTQEPRRESAQDLRSEPAQEAVDLFGTAAPVPETVVARRKPGRPRRESAVSIETKAQTRETAVAPRKPGRPRREPAPEIIFIERAAPASTPPVFVKNVAKPFLRAEPSTHGHVSHFARAEAATNLPRGERWKRRVPKVLW
jgi:hypothetical protein